MPISALSLAQNRMPVPSRISQGKWSLLRLLDAHAVEGAIDEKEGDGPSAALTTSRMQRLRKTRLVLISSSVPNQLINATWRRLRIQRGSYGNPRRTLR